MMMDGKLFEEALSIVLREMSFKQMNFYQKLYNFTKIEKDLEEITKLCSGCGKLMKDYHADFITKEKYPIRKYKYCCAGVGDDSCEVSYCYRCLDDLMINFCECNAFHCDKCFENIKEGCNVCLDDEFESNRDL